MNEITIARPTNQHSAPRLEGPHAMRKFKTAAGEPIVQIEDRRVVAITDMVPLPHSIFKLFIVGVRLDRATDRQRGNKTRLHFEVARAVHGFKHQSRAETEV